MTTFPRAHLDVSTAPVNLAASGQPPIRPLLVAPEPRIDWLQILFENHYIGIHRFFYALMRMPALITLVVCTWTIWGKRENEGALGWKLKGMGIAGMVVGIWIGFGWLSGLQNHYNRYKKAKYQTMVRLVHLFATMVFTLVMLVFASLAISDLRGMDNPSTPVGANQYSLNERIVHSAIVLGMSIMVVSVAILSFVYGILAYARLLKDSRHAKSGQPGSSYAYDNSGFPVY